MAGYYGFCLEMIVKTNVELYTIHLYLGERPLTKPCTFVL